jgi:hypothetical protein
MFFSPSTQKNKKKNTHPTTTKKEREIDVFFPLHTKKDKKKYTPHNNKKRAGDRCFFPLHTLTQKRLQFQQHHKARHDELQPVSEILKYLACRWRHNKSP